LLVIGNIGMVASLLIMAILIWTMGIQSSAWIMGACRTLFIIFFGFTWGPVLWVMLPELFPMRARGAATGIAALVLSIGSLLVAQFFAILTEVLAVDQVFLTSPASAICLSMIVINYTPEILGHTL